jgi:hypothetical protein
MGQHVLVFPFLLKKVDEDDKSIVVREVRQMFIKGWCCSLSVSFKRCFGLESLLLPKKWNTSSDLNERIHEFAVNQQLLSFDEIGNITIIIESSG